MGVELKFCGLTRRDDANHAASLGAAYVGVIFAGGPRTRTAEQARDILGDIPASVSRVGVFADHSPAEIGRIADCAGLRVAQLHGGSDAARIAAVRREFGGQVWAVERVSGSSLPSSFDEVLADSDAVLLDAYVPGALGGTGVALPWSDLAAKLATMRVGRRIVLAGGLRPENVADAIAALGPDVVDVSSGVEVSPGIKNHDRMRAFRDAVLQARTPYDHR